MKVFRLYKRYALWYVPTLLTNGPILENVWLFLEFYMKWEFLLDKIKLDVKK
jgi:hypothetical protein